MLVTRVRQQSISRQLIACGKCLYIVYIMSRNGFTALCRPSRARRKEWRLRDRSQHAYIFRSRRPPIDQRYTSSMRWMRLLRWLRRYMHVRAGSNRPHRTEGIAKRKAHFPQRLEAKDGRKKRPTCRSGELADQLGRSGSSFPSNLPRFLIAPPSGVNDCAGVQRVQKGTSHTLQVGNTE